MAETNTLSGRRIVITRPRQIKEELSSSLQNAGASIIHLPCIRFNALPLNQNSLRNITRKTCLVFTSQVAVGEFFKQTEALHFRLPEGIICCALNEKTAQVLNQNFNGRYCNAMARNSREFANFLAGNFESKNIIHPVSRAADATLETQLQAAGLAYHRLDIYEPVAAIDKTAFAQLLQNVPDLLVFYSPSAVAAFAQALPTAAIDLIKNIHCAAIGSTTAAALQQNRFSRILVSREPTSASMFNLIAGHFRNTQNSIQQFDHANIR